MGRKKIKRDRFTDNIPMQESMEPLIEIIPVVIEQDNQYIEWIRNSVVAHLDSLGWSFETFAREDKKRLVDNLRKLFPDLGRGGTGTPSDYKKGCRTAFFANQSRYHNDKIEIFIRWDRDMRKSPAHRAKAEVRLNWLDKFNYSGYRTVAYAVEECLMITKLNGCWLSYAEIALDTLVGLLAEYMHQRVLLTDVRENQYFHHSWKMEDVIPGIDSDADNWYQGNREKPRHLYSHMMTNYPMDRMMNRHIYRLELRFREIRQGNPFFRYGGNSVKYLWEHKDKILEEQLMWREPNPERMSDWEKREFANKAVIEWVIYLMGRLGDKRVKHRDARRRPWIREKDPLLWSFI